MERKWERPDSDVASKAWASIMGVLTGVVLIVSAVMLIDHVLPPAEHVTAYLCLWVLFFVLVAGDCMLECTGSPPAQRLSFASNVACILTTAAGVALWVFQKTCPCAGVCDLMLCRLSGDIGCHVGQCIRCGWPQSVDISH
jgi:hypothetical protein